MSAVVPSDDVIAKAVQLASRAPSIHNSQPWRWTVDGTTLHLHLDRDRLVATDTSGRQALISCGAALDHLRVAMSACGWATKVNYYPHDGDHTHLAAIHFVALPFVDEDRRSRADAILRRRSDRLPFAAPPARGKVAASLRGAVGGAAFVDVLESDAHQKLAEVTQLIDTLRLSDSDYHAELRWWTAPFGANDGISPSSLVSSAESDRVAVGRTFPVTRHSDRRLEIPEDRSAVLVLSARDDTRLEVLRCGEALSAVLLEATMAGLATCTLTHLTELPDSIAVLSAMTGRRLPQVLVRVGVTPWIEAVPPPTPRRQLSDFLEFRLPPDEFRLPPDVAATGTPRDNLRSFVERDVVRNLYLTGKAAGQPLSEDDEVLAHALATAPAGHRPGRWPWPWPWEGPKSSLRGNSTPALHRLRFVRLRHDICDRFGLRRRDRQGLHGRMPCGLHLRR